MLRLTCWETGRSIWIRPEMILAMVTLPAHEDIGERTRVDIDSDLECFVVRESPDYIAFLCGCLLVII